MSPAPTRAFDAARLDTPAELEALDPAQMLRAVASSAAQVREAAATTGPVLEAAGPLPRPRALVVLGMGGSGVAADVLTAVAGPGCPVPVLAHKGYGLPGWVGAADAVIAVSCSGETEETLSGVEQAIRRGVPLVAVGNPASSIALMAEQAGAPLLPAAQGRQPRASLWSLSLPVLLAAEAFGLLTLPPAEIEAAAARLEEVALRCRPDQEAFLNPAKTLAVELSDVVACVWGGSALAGVAAYRFACQLNENAKTPAVHGVLPEADHNQVVAFDGPFGGGRSSLAEVEDDFFRDREDDPEGAAVRGLRLVLLRDDAADPDPHPQLVRRCDASVDVAGERGVPVTQLQAEGTGRLERLASLVGMTDYASVYLALGLGLDPTPVEAIQDLKARIRA